MSRPTVPFLTVPFLKTLIRTGPSLAVLLLLGGLGAWGHHTGWRAPKLALLFQKAEPAAPEDWCADHNVPESKCVACHPELISRDPKDWCKEHGVPESKCAICHPELLKGEKAADWCAEHGVPESQCTICHPELAVRGAAPKVDSGIAVTAAEPSQLGKDPRLCRIHELRVQFASPQALEKAGIRLVEVRERPLPDRLEAVGELEHDPSRLAKISARVSGTVWKLFKRLGDSVRQGDLVAVIDAPDAGRAKAEWLQAAAQVEARERTLKRIEKSVASSLRTEVEREEAAAALREARIRRFNAQQALAAMGLPLDPQELLALPADEQESKLRFLGLPSALLDSPGEKRLPATLVPVLAPRDGAVLEQEAIEGEGVEGGKMLFLVGETARLWLTLSVPAETARLLAARQAVLFAGREEGAEAAAGELFWISPRIDEKTRTVQARAEIDNASGFWRAGAFGKARILIREKPAAAAVPDEAVHWEGCCHLVFVRVKDEVFQPRKVRLGMKSGGYTEVLAGVAPGEVIAAAGSHVLKAEILKSALGAGCCAE